MTYQVRYYCGYEIYVYKGNLGRVVNSHNAIVFEGTYEQCVAWLEDRGVKRIG